MSEQRIFTPEEYTGPSEFVHWHNHTVFSTLDGVATPEQYAARCQQRRYPAMAATEHGHMGSVPDMLGAFKKFGVKYVAGCFLSDQPVYVMSGVKKISDIVPGDKAFTHTADFKVVNNIQVRNYEGDLVRIKAWGIEDQVCTPEHPFLVREVVRAQVKKGVWEESISTGWVRARDIIREKYHRTYDTKRSRDRSNKRRYRHYLCVPRLPTNLVIGTITLADYIFPDNQTIDTVVVGDMITSAIYSSDDYRTTKQVNIPVSIELCDELLWIMGLWLAEGSVNEGGPHFSLGGDEYHFYERIAVYFANLGINTSHRPRDGAGESRPRAALDVQVYSAYFGRLFAGLFGTGFAGKEIPPLWLMELSPDQARALVDGIFDGDAKIGLQQSYLKLNNRTLIWQVRMLMTKYEVPQCSAVTQTPCNNSDNMSYVVRRRESGHFYYDYDDQYIYLPVYDVQRELYVGKVYNIEVADDNSYFTGVAVHNCEVYFNDYEPLRRANWLGKSLRPLKDSADPNERELYSALMRNRHLTLIAKNDVGFSNLIKLTTQAYETGYYYGRPRVWFDKLCEYREGLIVLSGCLNGPVCHELRRIDADGRRAPRLESADKRGAVDWIKKFKKVFGEDYLMEVQMPGIPDDDWLFRQLVALADHFKLEIVLANDCCHPDTMVSTDQGLCCIGDVEVGDKVLTHRGRYKVVEFINRRRTNDSLVCIKVGSETHMMTKNHPVAIWDSSIPGVRFVPAGDITSNQRLFFPEVEQRQKRIDDVDLSGYLKSRAETKIVNGFIRTTSPRSPHIDIPSKLQLTEELCYLIGLYAAEGSVDQYHDYKLSFALHVTETVQIEKVMSFFRRFGLKPQLKKVTENGVSIRICSAPFANFFEGLCGSGHLNKKLPDFWRDLSNEQLRALLAGCIDGDGSIGETCVSFFSTSQRLVYDVRLAITRFERYSAVKYRGQAVDKRQHVDISAWNRLYYISYGLGLAQQLGLLHNKSLRDEGTPRWGKVTGGFSIQIGSLSVIEYDGEVVNLQVAEDETYCLMNICTHNCHYLERRDYELQKVMMAIDQKTTVDDPGLFHVNSDEQYMKSRAELWARFKNNGYSRGVPDSLFERMCDNTLVLAERCVTPKFDSNPKYPALADADNKLCELVTRRLVERRLHKVSKRYLIDGREVTYREQMEIELARIIDKGFSSYFLITQDIIAFGSSKQWPFSPRGSAGGSLVNYLLGISPINPLPWGLSFDRFLSPSRGGFMLNVKMPEPIQREAAVDAVLVDGDRERKWNTGEKITTQ